MNKSWESLKQECPFSGENLPFCPNRGEKQVRITLVLQCDYVGFQIINFLTTV